MSSDDARPTYIWPVQSWDEKWPREIWIFVSHTSASSLRQSLAQIRTRRAPASPAGGYAQEALPVRQNRTAQLPAAAQQRSPDPDPDADADDERPVTAPPHVRQAGMRNMSSERSHSEQAPAPCGAGFCAGSDPGAA